MLFKMFFIAFSHQLVRSVAHLFGSSKPKLNNKITKQERKEMMKNCFSEGKAVSTFKSLQTQYSELHPPPLSESYDLVPNFLLLAYGQNFAGTCIQIAQT